MNRYHKSEDEELQKVPLSQLVEKNIHAFHFHFSYMEIFLFAQKTIIVFLTPFQFRYATTRDKWIIGIGTVAAFIHGAGVTEILLKI